jgi:ElaB/YqjD/DUF883 family membrane-anchored ribosome-binding protein
VSDITAGTAGKQGGAKRKGAKQESGEEAPSAQGGSKQQSEQTVGENVAEQATAVKDKGRRELRAQLDDRTTHVGQQAKSFAQALRRSGTELKGQSEDGASVERITSNVADRLEKAGGYFERANGEEMLRDAERFARARPWLVASGAAALGLVASRIFKASSEKRYDKSSRSHSSPMTHSIPSSGRTSGEEPVSIGSRPIQTTGVAG